MNDYSSLSTFPTPGAREWLRKGRNLPTACPQSLLLLSQTPGDRTGMKSQQGLGQK